MTDSKSLLELAERVEALTGPCRETDAKIAIAVQQFPDALNLRIDPDDDTGWLIYEVIENGDVIDCCDKAESYTASLDAAMTLGGFLLVGMSEIAADGLPAVCLCSDTSTTPPAKHWGIASYKPEEPTSQILARCYTAAALRALAAKEPGQ